MDFDNLIFFIFIAVSAAASWLQKRREKAKEVSWDEVEGADEGGEAKPPKPAAEKGGGFNLEDEFKRMVRELSGEPEAPMAKPVPPPPPTQPPPVPRPIFDEEPQKARGASPGRSEPSPFGSAVMTLQEARREAERIRRSAKKVKEYTPRSRKTGSRGTSIIRNLRSPRSAREAVLASVVLSPPKAME